MSSETPAADLVSILIPAYNAGPWIRQSIESALAQTWTPTEIIVADDGSTDDTASVAGSFEPRVRLYPGEHRGGNAARNRLLREARGGWLQYLDADDYLLPEKIASQMRWLAGHPEVDVAYSPVILRYESSGVEERLPVPDHSDVALHFIRWIAFNTTGFLYRKSAVEEVGCWDEDQAACQEHELMFRLFQAGKRFGFIDTFGSVYRNHGTGTVSRKHPLRTITRKLELLEKMEALLKERGQLTRDHRRALYGARMESARSAWCADAPLASQIAARAARDGRWMLRSSSALPVRYQFSSLLLGFDGAERLAAWRRRVMRRF
jgi:glycosyltransferase involved in cell wall biosynthesis